MGSGRDLDALARELASGEISRRAALRRLGAAAIGIGTASIPGAQALGAAASKRCPSSRRCDGKCCPKHSHCKRSKCRCDSGYTKCGKKCVDLTKNPNNCGDCGVACGAGEVCIGGQCAECTQDVDCQDGSQCTVNACQDGVCTSTPIDIDDGIPCTLDACDPNTGNITHTPQNGVCSSNQVCDPDSGCVCAAGFFDCDGTDGCECAGTACCGSSCQPAHSNGIGATGLGQTYYDCNPLGTPGTESSYTQTMAAEARAAAPPGITDGTGTCGGEGAVVRSYSDHCYVWIYSGTLAGYVRYNDVNAMGNFCLCPTSNSYPTWN